MGKWKSYLTRVILALLEIFLPEGEDLLDERIALVKNYAKKHELFKTAEYEYKTTLQEMFELSKFEATYLWGDEPQITKEIFTASIPLLAGIINFNTLKKCLKN